MAVLSQFRYLPRFLAEARSFERLGGKTHVVKPVLSDYGDAAGTADGHYFHQDLLVASFVFEKSPARHVDIGSRIDGFVAHVASFRPVDVLDIRKLDTSVHPNISFFQADIMNPTSVVDIKSDSVSCLHALEHFGLGRYGDPLDPEGHLKGFKNLVRILKPGGILYLSFPIGRGSATIFNAHRVFEPREVLSWPVDEGSLELLRFDYVDDNGNLHKQFDLLELVPEVEYGCGIYTFEKSAQ